MGYRSIGYSVIDRFGERIWTGDKKHCELMIRANGWQNVMLVEIFGYQKQTVKKKKKAPPKKVAWQIEHKAGTVLSFPIEIDCEEVAKKVNSLKGSLKRVKRRLHR